MKNKQATFKVRASASAVRAALLAMSLAPAAYTANAIAQTAEELTKPAGTVEVGVGNVSDDSYKAGEYNGLQKKGAFAIGNFDIRGGGAYDSTDPTRWRIFGTDLGLDTRNVTGQYSQQGKFRIDFGYDQLRHNRSDSYMTPLSGAGTDTLILPSDWLVPIVPVISGTTPNARGLNPAVATSDAIVGGRIVSPSAANIARSNSILAADIPDFHLVPLQLKRTRYDAGFAFDIDQQWDVQASYRHDHKDGLKAMGTVSRNAAAGGTSSLGDISTVIPDLIDQDIDQFNASVNFKGEKSFLTAAYYGSMFKNAVQLMSWQNWATGPTGSGTMNSMSSAPDNQFHQFALSGGYKFTPSTKLVVNASYARNTQNEAFNIVNNLVPVMGATSLNGLVVTTALNAKLTAKPVKNLNLTANFKYDKRDNQTPVHIYQFADAGDPTQIVPSATNALGLFPAGPNNPLGAVLAFNANANRPYSKKIVQFNFDADYMLFAGQWLKGGYDFQKIDRYCNGSWIDCADAATTKENTLRGEWRGDFLESLNARVSYAYSQRRVDNYNENAFLALVPYANVIPVGQTISAYQAMLLSGLTGAGPFSSGLNGGVFAGTGLTAAQAAFFFPNNNALANTAYANNNRISELVGMRRYFVSDRNRDKLRSMLNWQASEQVSVQAGVDYNRDKYTDAVYGLQNTKSWALNFEGSYAASDDLFVSLFYSFEDLRSLSAGNSYNGNSTATSVAGFTAISGPGCFATIAARNAVWRTDPCANWTSDQRDQVDTLGLALTKRNLVPKTDVVGSLIFTRARSDNSPTAGTYTNNPFAVTGAPAGTAAAIFVPATPLPTITTDTIELRLNGQYRIDKHSAVRFLYSYLRMKSYDYAYAAMVDGGIVGQFPTFETAPNFKIHVVGASYVYTF